ncbi:MAG: hypothetical protein NC179_00725 [[Eubacterium] siraeum]|nr:hypothetical protein [[Eubacterium] siraeum]
MSVGILCACNNDDDFRNPRNGEPEAGAFYTLQQAYDNGWLSKNQLKSISYYHAEFERDTKMFGNYKPLPLNPNTLSNEVETNIKQAYLLNLQELISDGEIDGIHIRRYYGTYNNLVAVTIVDDYINVDLNIEEECSIGGVKFYNYGHQIKIYAK